MNYRHHADGCHAYKILRDNDVPAENIITMMYDDVANANENPYPGKLFNKPTDAGDQGVDVYEGCKIDYSGKDVTAANFIAVITGDKSTVANAGNGRVLTSTSSDRVFLNFVDHGGPGLVAMPEGPYLYKDDLQEAVKKMHTNNMYKKLVFYVEACNSGSMFTDFSVPEVYVTTAANAKEPSWGTYCPPQDSVDGKHLGSCLGDLYSINWMEDADAAKMKKETLEDQFKTVKKETKKSHVLQFGDLTIDSEPVGDFEAKDTAYHRQLTTSAGEGTALKNAAAVDSRDVALVTLMWNYIRSPMGDNRHAAYMKIMSELMAREEADTKFEGIASAAFGVTKLDIGAIQPANVTNLACLKRVNEEVEKRCGAYSDYSMKHMQVVVNLCEEVKDTETILKAVVSSCGGDDCCLDGDCCHGVEYCCDPCNGSCRCSVGGKCN